MTSFPGIGDTIPDIALETPDGAAMRASDFRGRKLVLFFYPKDSTPGCTTENIDFSALLPQFEQAGTAVVGISKDSARRHANFIAKHDLKAPLATDPETGGLSDALGIWTEKKNYGRTYMGMVRTTYLIDAQGVIAQIWNKVRVKDHAAAVLEAAKAL